MYTRRIRIFIIISAAVLLVCLLRLVQMQLQSGSAIQEKIKQLKLQQGRSVRLMTTRGRILDAKSRVLAEDKPRFYIGVEYGVTCFADERFVKADFLRFDRRVSYAAFQEKQRSRLVELEQIIDKCSGFGVSREDIEDRIERINDTIWNLREYIAWKRSFPERSFEQAFGDANERLVLAAKVNIAEMEKTWPLVELKDSEDIFTAQVEFSETAGVHILADVNRFYPYGPVGCHTIGWVGRASQAPDKELFGDDELAGYLEGELCGREDGVEYVCEAVLRGRRGKAVYDIDNNLVSRTENRPGADVKLTLDIELQKDIEDYMSDCELNENCEAPTAAVVINVADGDILALVSRPGYDLNNIRQDYGRLLVDAGQPLLNRAINKVYPPGSVVKPLILIAALESGRVARDEIISCPAAEAPAGWPNCWIFNRFGVGHSDSWANNARNAIKGSCNIYFSRVAARLEPGVLQRWLYEFGYGRAVSLGPANFLQMVKGRSFRQAQGVISSSVPKGRVLSFGDLPALSEGERRFFGIGQGNLRVTVLQVANAMAAIGRGGIYKPPRLIGGDPNAPDVDGVNLNVSPQSLDVVREGMAAVVSEPGGTAEPAFRYSGFKGRGINVFGKTGSTELPDTAWFAGFAEDARGGKVALALVVEGGQHGSRDAAPLARRIIDFCIKAGYLGERN